jgi:hypothetical protein
MGDIGGMGDKDSNMQNCEFCGSLLIRLQQSGINVATSDYKDSNAVFKGLVGALKRNLDLQKASNYTVDVGTDIYLDSRCIAFIMNDIPLLFPTKSRDGKPHLMVLFMFFPDTEGGDELCVRKFRNLDIYELFIENIQFNDGVKGYDYAIDFGGDAEGAARLLSRVIHDLYLMKRN